MYAKNIWHYPDVLNYLINTRKISKDSIVRFSVGYACDKILSEHISDDSTALEIARKHKLVGHDYDFFDGYITFPIYDLDNCYNINGRAFGDYAVTHKTVFDIEKNVPFNPDALKKTSVMITESPIDTITLVQAGFNATAILSSAMSMEMTQLFEGLSCYIMLDTDDSGRNGTHKVASKLWGVAKKIYDVKIPGNLSKKEDANSYFCRNPEATARIKFLLKNSWPISEPLFKYIPEHKTKTMKQLDVDVDIVELGRDLFKDEYKMDKGKEVWVRCPHHKAGTEQAPSLRIGGKKNIFYCYGCQVGGGPIHLVHWHLGVTWEEAEEWLLRWKNER